jgi:hypothetical protein
MQNRTFTLVIFFVLLALSASFTKTEFNSVSEKKSDQAHANSTNSNKERQQRRASTARLVTRTATATWWRTPVM